MSILTASLGQMAYLFLLLLLGFLLIKCKLLPQNAETVLSKLENYIFIPALVLETFITNFTAEKIGGAASLFLRSIVLEAAVIALSLLLVRLLARDRYTQNIYLYGLCFSNFGFMGNALISGLFPDIFFEYIIFTLPLWMLIYLWGVPALLKDTPRKRGMGARLLALVNPMLLCMLVGIALGLLQVKIPSFLTAAIGAAGGCMSPVAMLITGMTVARIDIQKVLKKGSIYTVSLLRLVLYPLLFIGAAALLKIKSDTAFYLCAVAALAMPLGLNTIVIPGAYEKDTTVAAGMAIVSHVLSLVTIPLLFALVL